MDTINAKSFFKNEILSYVVVFQAVVQDWAENMDGFISIMSIFDAASGFKNLQNSIMLFFPLK